MTAVVFCNAETNITLSGVNPAPVVWRGKNMDNWIIGTFTINCTTTSKISTTTDIAPRQETYDRNKFTYINTGEIVQIQGDEIYKTQQVYDTVIKMWGIDTDQGSSNNFL